MPDERNEGHYKSFSDVFGEVTTEEHRPSRKLAKKTSHGIPFNPSKQHTINTNLITECTECKKFVLSMRRKKISAGNVRASKRVIYDLLYVCGSSVEE